MSKNKPVEALRLGGEIAAEVALERLFDKGKYNARALQEYKAIEKSREFTRELTGASLADLFYKRGYGNYFGAYRGSDNTQVAAGTLFWNRAATIEDLRTPPRQFDPAVADYLRQLPTGSVAEIGSMAKVRGKVSKLATMAVYREMFCFAEENDIRYFVAGLHPSIWPAYKHMFADGVRLMHAPDKRVYPPGAKGAEKMGVVLDVRNSARIYQDSINGHVSTNWPEAIFGVNVDGDTPTQGVGRSLTTVAMHLLIFEYFRNRVGSFQAITRI